MKRSYTRRETLESADRDTKKSIVIGIRDHRARGNPDTPRVHAPADGVIEQPTRQQIIANDLPVLLHSYRALYRPKASPSDGP